jgi:hypothetical protein
MTSVDRPPPSRITKFPSHASKCAFIEIMNDTYSVSDLARIVARVVSFPEKPAERDIDLAIRRLRGWTLAGALVPIGDPHAGTGRHRQYDRSAMTWFQISGVRAPRLRGVSLSAQ